MRVIHALPLNPEPWAIGPVGYARRKGSMSAYVGRNQQLHAYQEAVRELLDGVEMMEGPYKLTIYFWRNVAEYTTPAQRQARKHDADVTNLLKGTEDALQGILIGNDRDVRHVQGILVDQGPDVIPSVVIVCESWIKTNIPDDVLTVLDTSQQVLPFDDDSARWTPPSEGSF